MVALPFPPQTQIGVDPDEGDERQVNEHEGQSPFGVFVHRCLSSTLSASSRIRWCDLRCPRGAGSTYAAAYPNAPLTEPSNSNATPSQAAGPHAPQGFSACSDVGLQSASRHIVMRLD